MKAARAILLLATLATIACGTADGASSDPAAIDEGEIATGASTKVVSGMDDKGRTGSFAFEIVSKGGKRVAVVHAQRGDDAADLDCSQLVNIHDNESEDEVVTLCEEQIQPGYEYVSAYFRYRPKSKRWSYDVIAAHPENLSAHQRELFELLSGAPVKTPPPPGLPARHMSHREQVDKLSLKSAVRGTDPFVDPIALAREVHSGFRGALGSKANDRRSGVVEYTVERMTAYTDFDTLVYPVNVLGRGADGRWHNGYSLKVPVTASPTTLATPEKITESLKSEIARL